MRSLNGILSGSGINGLLGPEADLLPAIDVLNPDPTTFLVSEYGYSSEGGFMMIDITRTNPYSGYSNGEFLLGVTQEDNNNNRMFINIDNSPQGRRQCRVEANNSQYMTQNPPVEGFFIAKRSVAAIWWGKDENGDEKVVMFHEGVPYQVDANVIIPADNTIEVICCGRYTDATNLLTTGTINRFLYYNRPISYDMAISLSRNDNTINGLSGDASRQGIMFLGQSNSSGRGSGSLSYSNAIKLLGNDGVYGTYSDPYDDNTNALILNEMNDTGADLSYAGICMDILAEDGDEYFAVPANEGGTGFTSDWDLYIEQSGTPTDQFLRFLPLAAGVRLQMARQAASGQNPICTVWHQGASDAYDAMTGATYKSQWKAFISWYRQVMKNINHPIILCTIHKWQSAQSASATEAEWNAIITAQQELSSEVNNVHLVDLSDILGGLGDEVHLDTAGLGVSGIRIAKAIRENVLGQTLPDTIADILPEALIDLEATKISSLASTSAQVWTDIVGDKAFQLGSTAGVDTNDPTINGTAGDKAAHFTTDGNDYLFSVDDIEQIQKLHRTDEGTATTINIVFKTPSVISGSRALLGTVSYNVSDGFELRLASGSFLQWIQYEDGGGTLATVNMDSVVADTWYHFSLVVDTPNSILKHSLNGKAYTSKTYTPVISEVDAPLPLFVMSRGDTLGGMTSGSGVKSLSITDKNCTDEDLAKLVNLYNMRHEFNYGDG